MTKRKERKMLTPLDYGTDENGNPISVQITADEQHWDDGSMSLDELHEILQPEATSPSVPDSIWTPSRMKVFFDGILVNLSREPGKQYTPGQGGNRVFKMSEILRFCYRLDFPETDEQIAVRMSKLVRNGEWEKAGRQRYQASALTQMSMDDFLNEMAELDKRFSK